MIEVKGKYNSAKIFTDNVESSCISQIIELCNQEIFKGSKIRIMPDCHAGAGCVIGTTMTITDKVIPNIVGVDLGCGISVAELGHVTIDFSKLDEFIRNNIPSGHDINDEEYNFHDINDLRCYHSVNVHRALCSISSLGGGNHFIEVDKDEYNNMYVVVHSGSRYLGKQIAEFYQDSAYKNLCDTRIDIDKLVSSLKSQGRQREIQGAVEDFKISHNCNHISKSMSYVEGDLFDNYIHDTIIAQNYASLNRKMMLEKIVEFIGGDTYFEKARWFETRHNYVDVRPHSTVARKGSISARLGERVIIPLNMRDGSIIGIGKGNSDWNYSAPHGAGRVMSRSAAKDSIDIGDFRKSMNGIFTTSVSESTIDESPMVYKPAGEIIENIEPSVDIERIIKPVYNFKASE
jgi:RNA-splicing ligase RtcB